MSEAKHSGFSRFLGYALLGGLTGTLTSVLYAFIFNLTLLRSVPSLSPGLDLLVWSTWSVITPAGVILFPFIGLSAGGFGHRRWNRGNTAAALVPFLLVTALYLMMTIYTLFR